MPAKRNENWNGTAFPELHTPSQPASTDMTENQPPLHESAWVAEVNPATQFRFRILAVDDEPQMRELIQRKLESSGYEVLTAADGLEGLHALGKSLPDLIVSDLNMPRMSGHEFLAVVRERFPHIATVALSGETLADECQTATQVDAFLHKGHYTLESLCDEIGKLLAASPIRSPRDKQGYLTIKCSTCLRPNKIEAMALDGGLHEAICGSCGTAVNFEINHEIEPQMNRNDA